MALTNEQSHFVEENFVDTNTKKAAIRAGYSSKTAGQIGEQNLKCRVFFSKRRQRAPSAQKARSTLCCASRKKSLSSQMLMRSVLMS